MPEKKYNFDYTDVLFYIGMILMAIWAAGYSLEWFRISGAILVILSIGLKLERILQKLDHVIEKVDKLDVIIKEHDKRITVLETKSLR